MISETARITRSVIVVCVLVSCSILVLLAAGCGPQQFKTPMFQPGEIQGYGPDALAWNGRDLILGAGGFFIELRPTDTGSFFSMNSPYNGDGFYSYTRDPVSLAKRIRICGLAWEGGCCSRGSLWVADSLNNEIFKIDLENGAVSKRLPAPGETPIGLAFDGENLWIADTRSSRIFKVSSHDGRVLSEYISPVKSPSGLAWDCAGLWVAGTDSCKHTSIDCYTPRMVRLDPVSGRVTQELRLPSKIARPAGLVWGDGTFWLGDFILNRVFVLSPTKAEDIADATVYSVPVSVKHKETRKVAVTQMAPVKEDAQRERDEARLAAEEAKKAAEEAKKAAEQSKKAFELQQIK